MDVKIEESWKRHISHEFEKPYFTELTNFVRTAYTSKTIYPAPKNMFRAFDLCPFEKVAVVILGQDPYHGAHQANGLSFAVEEGMQLPPSLQNIFKEIELEFGEKMKNRSGDLSRWAEQGVLLLNATLTVEAKKPGSHQKKGWEAFTDAAIKAVSDQKENIVFMLWGKYAQNKGAVIDTAKHLVLQSAHPSPFSADKGFFGNNHFTLANKYLIDHNKKPIDWLS